MGDLARGTGSDVVLSWRLRMAPHALRGAAATAPGPHWPPH